MARVRISDQMTAGYQLINRQITGRHFEFDSNRVLTGVDAVGALWLFYYPEEFPTPGHEFLVRNMVAAKLRLAGETTAQRTIEDINELNDEGATIADIADTLRATGR